MLVPERMAHWVTNVYFDLAAELVASKAAEGVRTWASAASTKPQLHTQHLVGPRTRSPVVCSIQCRPAGRTTSAALGPNQPPNALAQAHTLLSTPAIIYLQHRRPGWSATTRRARPPTCSARTPPRRHGDGPACSALRPLPVCRSSGGQLFAAVVAGVQQAARGRRPGRPADQPRIQRARGRASAGLALLHLRPASRAGVGARPGPQPARRGGRARLAPGAERAESGARNHHRRAHWACKDPTRPRDAPAIRFRVG